MTTFSLERFAELLALAKHFGPEGDEALLRSGVEPEAFHDAEAWWNKALVRTVEREETGDLHAFGLRFAAERARLRKLKPTLASLGELPEPAPPTAREQRPPTAPGITLLESAAPAIPASSSETNPPGKNTNFERPTYLARLVETGGELNPDETLALMVRPPVGPATPFAGSTSLAQLAALKAALPPPEPRSPDDRVEETLLVPSPLVPHKNFNPTRPPETAPRKREPFVAMTEELPSSEEVARLIREADPQVALARAATQAPTSAVAKPMTTSDSHTGDAEPNVDETLMLRSSVIAAAAPSGTFRDAMTRLVVPAMKIAEYARFRAALRVHGEEHEPTLRQFGVTSIELRDALQDQFAKRFQVDGAAQTEFLTIFEQRLRELTGGGS